jgi:plastocyanin
MNKRNFFLLSVLVMLAAMVLTACGPKAVTFDVEMKDFAFEPNTWEVPAGANVTLNLTNTGTQEHEYVIMILGKDVTLPFDDDDEPNIFWEHEVEPGGTATVEFTAPTEPGVYNIVCGTAGHLEQGMEGTLTIK